MATNAEFVEKLRAAGVPEDRITTYLAKKTGSEQAAQGLIAKGVDPARVNDYLAKRMTAQQGDEDGAPIPLKPNDALGFVNGATKTFNNVFGAGSDALQAVGVPEDTVHAVGGVLRDPFGPLVPGKLMNKDQLQELNEQAAGAGQRPGKLGQFGGEVAATIPAAVASAALAPEALAANGIRVSSPMAARALAAASGQGFKGAAVQGALAGAQTTDKTDAQGVALDALGGGLGGVVGQGVNAGIGGFVAPRFGPAMNELLNIGQKKFSLAMLTGSKYAKTAEDALRSVPGLGGFVEGSQNAAARDFNRAYLERAAAEADLAVPYFKNPTSETYGDIKNAFKERYAGIDSRVNMTLDKDLYQAGKAGAARTIEDVVSSGQRADLSQAARELFNPAFDAQTNTWTYGNLTGKQFQDIDSALRAQAKALRNPGAGKAQTYGGIEEARRIEEARDVLKDAIKRQQPDLADKMARADKGYAMFKRAQEAVTKPGQGVDPEAFSAKALYEQTMNAQGRNARIDQGSSGDLPGQKLATAALQVMGNKIGDSGTPLRTAVGKVVSGDIQGLGTLGAAGAAHGAGVTVAPGAVAGVGLLYGGYAPGVRDLIANTVIGNSKNKLFRAARSKLDERALNNAVRLQYNAAGTAAQGIEENPEYRININGKRQRFNPETGQYEDTQ